MSQDSLYSFRGEVVPIGLSAAVGITAAAGQQWLRLHPITVASATLFMGHTTVVAPGWSLGTPIPTSAALDFPSCKGTFYLSAAGATVLMGVVRGFNTPIGASLI